MTFKKQTADFGESPFVEVIEHLLDKRVERTDVLAIAHAPDCGAESRQRTHPDQRVPALERILGCYELPRLVTGARS